MTLAFDDLDGKNVGVWGVGVEGRAALEALPSSARAFILADDPATPGVAEAGVEFAAAVVTPADAIAEGFLDVVVRSPAISTHRSELVEMRSRGIVITSLLELWLASSPVPRTVGVTGTKGKSTTSLLIAELLKAGGASAEVAGNIGRPCTAIGDTDFAVLEVSSYQAADITVSPAIGVLTNLGEDHLPWHGSLRNYHADKLHLFANSELEHLLAPNSCAKELLEFVPSAARIRLDPADVGFAHDAGVLFRQGRRILDLSDTALAPVHMSDNAVLACATAEVALGRELPIDALAEVLRAFVLPRGRLEVVSTDDGFAWVNDPLASNPMAAAAAVLTYSSRNVILIIGGDDRQVDPSPLIDAIRRHGRVRAVIAIGSAGSTWQHLLETSTTVVPIDSDDVALAVSHASRIAQSGDVVLFSPAAPTTRHVGNWEDRMRAFEQAIRDLS